MFIFLALSHLKEDRNFSKATYDASFITIKFGLHLLIVRSSLCSLAPQTKTLSLLHACNF